MANKARLVVELDKLVHLVRYNQDDGFTLVIDVPVKSGTTIGYVRIRPSGYHQSVFEITALSYRDGVESSPHTKVVEETKALRDKVEGLLASGKSLGATLKSLKRKDIRIHGTFEAGWIRFMVPEMANSAWISEDGDVWVTRYGLDQNDQAIQYLHENPSTDVEMDRLCGSVLW